jgi:SAM-dependent methyltransferase
VAVTYNVLEALPSPAAFLTEIARVLRPGGRAIVAHVDFDSLIAAGPEPILDRKIIHAFADLAEPWIGAHADGRIGRKLPGLVRHSPLAFDTVQAWTTTASELAGHAAHRVDNIREGLHSAVRKSRTTVTAADVDTWYQAVLDAHHSGRFFFVETVVLVVAHRPI